MLATQLNIKDAATVRLARSLADRSRRSITAVIRHALEREWNEQEAATAERLRALDAIVDDFQRHMPPEWKTMTSKQIMDSIYDEDGLPT